MNTGTTKRRSIPSGFPWVMSICMSSFLTFRLKKHGRSRNEYVDV